MQVTSQRRRMVSRPMQWLGGVVFAVLIGTGALPVVAAPSAASPTAPHAYPQYIRVGRTFNTECINPPLIQRLDVVPFKDYVKNVLPYEWVASWTNASLDAGAVAVTQFAYQTAFAQGKWSAAGYAFDVVDSACDQIYQDGPGYARTNAAVERTWGLAMVRNGAWFTPYYRANEAACGGSGNCMSQWGSEQLGLQGLTGPQILRYYYGNIVFVSR